MWSIAAVSACGNVAARACRASWTSMATSAAIGKSRSNAGRYVDVPIAIAVCRSLALLTGEFALEDLPAASYGTERIAIDDEERGVRRHNVTAPSAYFIRK